MICELRAVLAGGGGGVSRRGEIQQVYNQSVIGPINK